MVLISFLSFFFMFWLITQVRFFVSLLLFLSCLESSSARFGEEDAAVSRLFIDPTVACYEGAHLPLAILAYILIVAFGSSCPSLLSVLSFISSSFVLLLFQASVCLVSPSIFFIACSTKK
jgi:hypothetical protein